MSGDSRGRVDTLVIIASFESSFQGERIRQFVTQASVVRIELVAVVFLLVSSSQVKIVFGMGVAASDKEILYKL